MVPVRGMEAVATEVLDARQFRQRRPAELAGGADQQARVQGGAVGQRHQPQRPRFVVACLRHLGAETQVRRQAVLRAQCCR